MKTRGLLEDTLVVWCTEFGRMPFFQKGAKGRDHNPDGFTAWLTGAGVQPGVSHGVTDALGRYEIIGLHPGTMIGDSEERILAFQGVAGRLADEFVDEDDETKLRTSVDGRPCGAWNAEHGVL